MNKQPIEAIDARVLEEMKRMRTGGLDSVTAGQMARRIGTDSVKALGAMLRVVPKYRRRVNKLA